MGLADVIWSESWRIRVRSYCAVGGDTMFLSGFFVWLGIGMSLGLLYALIKYGAPVFLMGIAVVLSIIFDCAKAFARGFTGAESRPRP